MAGKTEELLGPRKRRRRQRLLFRIHCAIMRDLLFLESAILELQRATILRYSPHNVVGYACPASSEPIRLFHFADQRAIPE